jgi:hypothetical protein
MYFFILLNKSILFLTLIFHLFTLSAQAPQGKKVKITSSKSGVLYLGVENTAECSQVDFNLLNIKTNNGISFKDEKRFIIMPSNVGTAIISLYKDSEFIDSIHVEVKRVPQPQLKLNGYVLDEKLPLNLLFLKTATELDIYFDDDLVGINKWYNVSGFSFGYVYGGHYMSFDNQGKIFNSKVIDSFRNVMPDTEIIFRVTLESSSEFSIKRPIFRFKVYLPLLEEVK